MIIYHDVEQGTPKWFKLREGLWTGSVAIRLLQGKTFIEQKITDFVHRRGHSLEIVAIREYERAYHTKVKRPGFVTNTVYTNAGYSPDGIDGAWLLECKAFEGKKHEDMVAEKIPLVVLVQIYFGMIITGKRKARLLAFNPEYEQQLTVVEIFYDKLIGNNIRKKLRLDMKNRRTNK
jgi:hypothetical protein